MDFHAQVRRGRAGGILRGLGYGALALGLLLVPLVGAAELGLFGALGGFALMIAVMTLWASAHKRELRRQAGPDAEAFDAVRAGPAESHLPAAVAHTPVGSVVFLLAGLFVVIAAPPPMTYVGWLWLGGSVVNLVAFALRRRGTT